MERVNQNTLRWTYDYCGLRTTTLFHDILILHWGCQQVKEDNLPPHWGSNPRTSVCEANALPLTPLQTAIKTLAKPKVIVAIVLDVCTAHKIILLLIENKEQIRHILRSYYDKIKNAFYAANKVCAVYGPDTVSISTAQRWFQRER